MKRFTVLLTLQVLIVLCSSPAFANGIKIFYGPNISGDNFGAFLWGPGIAVGLGGGTPEDFFGGSFGYAPGTTLGGSTDLFISGGFAQIGKNGYELLPLEVGTLFMSSITLPTNGKDFRANVEVGFSVLMEIVDTGEPLNVRGAAQGHIDFEYFDGTYYPGDFVQAPEPATLLLLATGLVSIGWLKRRGRNRPDFKRVES